jgi:antirestriction protein ArdC
MSKFDNYETVTNLIAECLEAGVVSWHVPWKTTSAIPCNFVSGKPYRGFNFWVMTIKNSLTNWGIIKWAKLVFTSNG